MQEAGDSAQHPRFVPHTAPCAAASHDVFHCPETACLTHDLQSSLWRYLLSTCADFYIVPLYCVASRPPDFEQVPDFFDGIVYIKQPFPREWSERESGRDNGKYRRSRHSALQWFWCGGVCQGAMEVCGSSASTHDALKQTPQRESW